MVTPALNNRIFSQLYIDRWNAKSFSYWTHLWSRVPHYGKVLGTLLSLSYWSLLEVFHLPLFSEPFWMKGEREENYSTLSLCIRRRFLISIVCTFRTRWVPFFVLLPLLLMNTISWLQNVCLGNVHFVYDNLCCK